MNKRNFLFKWSIYIAGVSFAVSVLTTGLLGAAIKEWIFMSPSLWLMVRVLVVVSSLCLVSDVALLVRALVIR